MKPSIFILSALLLPCFSHATPITDATIFQAGNEYSQISRSYVAQPRITGWIEQADKSIYSPWARHWAEYTAYLTKGVWDIGLNVINHGNLGNNWYSAFKVHSTLANNTLINEEILEILASDQQIHYGLSTVDIATAGQYTVRYEWLNDKWGGRKDEQRRDANIQINSAFFNRVPEPSTFALLGLGALIMVSKNYRSHMNFTREVKL